jgi:hypothetical protein
MQGNPSSTTGDHIHKRQQVGRVHIHTSRALNDDHTDIGLNPDLGGGGINPSLPHWMEDLAFLPSQDMQFTLPMDVIHMTNQASDDLQI